VSVYKFSAPGTLTTGRTTYTSMLAGNTPFVGESYESIQTVTVGSGGQSTITFSSIPSTYKHLQLRYFTRNSAAAYYVLLRFNSDTGTNYSYHQLTGNGTSASGAATINDTVLLLTRNGSPDNVFGAGTADILDYANTNKNKTVRAIGGYDRGTGDGQAVDFHSGLWRNTSAINTITLTVFAGNYAQYSSFALYGIKG